MENVVSCHLVFTSLCPPYVYINRLHHMPDNSLVKQVYKELFKLHEMGFLTWFTGVGKLIDTYSINTDKYCHPVFRLVSYLGLRLTIPTAGTGIFTVWQRFITSTRRNACSYSTAIEAAFRKIETYSCIHYFNGRATFSVLKLTGSHHK